MAEDAEVIAAVSEKTTNLYSKFIEQLAEAERLNREGKLEEGRLAIEQYYQLQSRELDLLERKMEIVRALNEENSKLESAGPIWDTPTPGFFIRGRCGNGSCDLYQSESYRNYGFGTFRIGPDFDSYTCAKCNRAFQEVERIGFLDDATRPGTVSLSYRVTKSLSDASDEYWKTGSVRRVVGFFARPLDKVTGRAKKATKKWKETLDRQVQVGMMGPINLLDDLGQIEVTIRQSG